MIKIQSKKAVELAINTVIMLIIGLVLFGLGMSLFFQIAGGGEDQVDQMRVEILDSLAGLECNSQEWLCVPTTKLDQGDAQTIYVYVTNLADTEQNIGISFPTSSSLSERTDTSNPKDRILTKSGCGSLTLIPYPNSIIIARGEVAKIPMFVESNTVSKACSFTTSIQIENSGNPGDGEKAPVVIQVK